MECTTCQTRAAIGHCVECRTALCDDCGITCQRCKKLVCQKHAAKTPGGRLLCPSCMDARNAAAERKRRERLGADVKPSVRPTPAPAPTPKAPTPHAPASKTPDEDLSFAALAGDAPVYKRHPEAEAREREEPEEVEREREQAPYDFEAEPKKEEKEKKSDPLAPMGKLDLGPIDENRPILTQSAQQSPGYWKYPVALIFFLIAAWFVYDRVPSLRPIVIGGILIGLVAFVIWGIRVWIARSQAYEPHGK